jgi:DNA repair protein RecN (Recombination protein N)
MTLTELRVENLGIIPELSLVLGDGLTAITGETGAGKTLLVEALQLLLGERADPLLVRAGAAEARVEGRFLAGDEECVLARVVPRDGRSRAYVDGRLATASELAERGTALVDLHGQHDHQSLLVPAQQRALLDAFAGADALDARGTLRAARAEQVEIDAALAALGGDERTRAREIDLLRYQLDEIDAARITDAAEDERLAADESLLADAEAHRAALDRAHDQLAGAAADAVGDAVAALTGRGPFAELETRARALQVDAVELAHDVRQARDGIVTDPAALAAVTERRHVLHELRRKYGDTLADVLAFASEARARVEELEGHAERVRALETRREHVAREVDDAAARLSKARHAAAPQLAATVSEHLAELALGGARFDVEIEDAEVGDDGADRVVFVLAPNPGEPPRPLARAASGGELSRTMLAIRLVLSEAPPTLVFDEVDAGIGGTAGTAVGRALRALGAHHQVLCVTHLPQVAAAAHTQVHVSKQGAGDRTVASAALLLDDARVSELARMLGGATTESARAHARELLDDAVTADAPRRRRPVASGRRRPARST